MATKTVPILLKQGLKAGLPVLQEGEPAFTTDTHELFIGTGAGNVQLAPLAHPLVSTTNHTVSGLTAGHVLRATGATSYAFGALQAADIPSLSMDKITSGSLATTRLVEPDYVTAAATKTTSPMFDVLRADRTAFLPASQIIIEQSTDAGVTWTDAGISDTNKMRLFTGQRPSINIPLKNGVKSTDCMVRITITAMRYNVPEGTAETDKYNYWNSNYVTLAAERYTTLDGSWVWINTNSDRVMCTVERATGAAPNVWGTERTAQMSGWSGGNYMTLSGTSFGGGITQTGNWWNWRFTFRTCSPTWTFNDADLATTYTTSVQTIYHIKTIGRNCYSYGNNMMYNDHLYNWDESKNAIFPAGVTSTGSLVAGIGGAGQVQAAKLAVSGPTDLVDNAPWYGLGLTNVAGDGGGNYVQLGGYYGLTLKTRYNTLKLNATLGSFTLNNNQLWDDGNGPAKVDARITKAAIESALTGTITTHTHNYPATGLVSIDGVSNSGGNVDLVAGAGITITPDTTAKTITIASSGVAAHASTHLAAGTDPLTLATGNRALITDENGHLAVSGASNMDLEYLSGVTNYVQSQIDGKEPTIANGTANQLFGMNSAANAKEWKTLALGSTGLTPHFEHTANTITLHVPMASTSGALAGYLSNTDYQKIHTRSHSVTSTSDHTVSGLTAGQVLRATGATTFGWQAIQAADLPTAIDAAKIANGNVSNTEFQYLDGVTSSIQTQLNGKADSSHNHDGVYSPVGHTHTGMVGKYSTTVGDGSAYTFTITHNLGTQDVVVSVLDIASGYTVVLVDWSAATTNTVTITCATAPPATGYRVTVIG